MSLFYCGDLPERAATLPTINSSVLFTYGSMSIIPFRIVSDTFAPKNKNNDLLQNKGLSFYKNELFQYKKMFYLT